MAVFTPDLSEEDNQAQIEKVSTFITNAGGTVKEALTESPWGRRRLAYTVRFNNVDYRDGFYTVYHFDAAPSYLAELERDLKLDNSTMRYLLVHDDPKAGEKFSENEAESVEEGAEAAAQTTESTAASNAPADQAPAAETTGTVASNAGTESPEADTAETASGDDADEEASTEAAEDTGASQAEAPAENAASDESSEPSSDDAAEKE